MPGRYVVVERIGDLTFQIGPSHDTLAGAVFQLADHAVDIDEDVDACVDGPDLPDPISVFDL